MEMLVQLNRKMDEQSIEMEEQKEDINRKLDTKFEDPIHELLS